MRRERVSTFTSRLACPVVGQFVTGESIQGIVVSGLHRLLVLRNLPKRLNSASQAGINVKITQLSGMVSHINKKSVAIHIVTDRRHIAP